jgi:hypothetical protein
VGPNASTATGGEVGSGIFYDNATAGLTINVAYGLYGFQPLVGNFTATHLHQAAAGVNGPVIINLDAGVTDIHTALGPNAGFFSGTVTLNPSQEAALFANLIYINVHSSIFGGGEIRAQFIMASTTAAPPAPQLPRTLALSILGANPVRGALALRCSLEHDGPARLDLYEVGGRRVAARDLRGGGLQFVELSETVALPAGVYFVRLAQGSRSGVVRVALLR